jgi:hypothetical protein
LEVHNKNDSGKEKAFEADKDLKVLKRQHKKGCESGSSNSDAEEDL